MLNLNEKIKKIYPSPLSGNETIREKVNKKRPLVILVSILCVLWSIVWNIFSTIVDIPLFLIMIVTGHKPHRNGFGIYFITRSKNWGGINFGLVSVVSPTLSVKSINHEFGHGLQGLVFGPLMPFVVWVPSFLRCAVFGYKNNKTKALILEGILIPVIFVLSTMAMISYTIWNCHLWLFILLLVLSIYFFIILLWFVFIELPRLRYTHEKNTQNGNRYYYYDDVWFEGSATAFGNYVINTYYNNNSNGNGNSNNNK